MVFPGLLMVLFYFHYKTAQKPFRNRLNLAWKPVQKLPQEMSAFYADFYARFGRFEQFFQKKTTKPLKSCWKTAQTAHILFLSGI